MASKTGTTNNDYDRWFVAYTPYFAGAVWFGYDINESVHFPGRNPSTLIWQAVMTRVHYELPEKVFNRPEEVEEEFICKESGLKASEICVTLGREQLELFIRGTISLRECEMCSNSTY